MARKETIDRIGRALRSLGERGHAGPSPWLGLNLTIAQLKSLLYIANEGGTNLKSLAAALGVTPPNVTGIVERLVEQGLVSRMENPDDRRMLILQPTAAGKALITRLREQHFGRMQSALKQLDDNELDALATGLDALVRVSRGS